MIGTAAALLTSALISAGTSAASGAIGSKAAKSAAKTQLDATTESNKLQKYMFDQNQENMKPWLSAGSDAIHKLSDFVNQGDSDFTGKFDSSKVQFDPGFDLRMKESQKAIDRWAAKTGTYGSTGTPAKLSRNAQDLTSQEYSNAYNRQMGEFQQTYNIFSQNRARKYNELAGVAGAGQSAASFLGNLGENYATTVGNNTQAGANAEAAGTVGSANSINGALGNIGSAAQQSLTLQSILGLGKKTQGYDTYNPTGLQPGYARG